MRVTSTQLSDRERDLRVREASLSLLHEYAAQMERVFVLPKSEKSKEPGPSVAMPPP